MISSDTIVACATPYGIGGIAVVRISGKSAIEIAQKVSNKKTFLRDRNASFVSLYSENGDAFDAAVMTAFLAPNSYTGENVVEISCHGSPTIVNKLINICVSLSARIAEPGEFTRRAFINGKIDLVQVEAVSALILSSNEKSSLINQRVLSGALSKKLNEVKDLLINALSFVEFELDISEEDLVEEPIKKILNSAKSAWRGINKLSSSYKEGRLINRGASVVITGRTNVGKSTLLNALLEENKAIVSETPGTTRDSIDAQLMYDGISITLTDTAGIRETRDSIEKEGVLRAINKAMEADLVIHVLDANEHNHPKNVYRKGSVITVLNKIDLLSATDIKSLNKYFKNAVNVSALTRDGISNLKKEIKKALHTSDIFSDEVYLITQRQHNITKTSLRSINNAIEKLKTSFPPLELVSVDLREALSAIDQMLGKTTSDDILNNIFSQFCVGK